MSGALSIAAAERLAECVAGGGVAVFPADTVYGLCCDPESATAVRRLYELKGRAAGRPAAVMFFDLALALAALPELGDGERSALLSLLPGPVTLLLANRGGRYLPACGADPATLGLRVPLLGERLAALATIVTPVMQSSANLSGGPDARRLADVPGELLRGADLVLDGGELPGTPSSVVDLRECQRGGGWRLLREGALTAAEVERLLARRGEPRADA